MRIQDVGLCCALSLSLSSCTSELVTKPLGNGAEPATGYPIRMPFTQFDVAIKWQAVSCEKPDNGPANIKVNISAEIEPKAALEPSRLYTADPRDLLGWTRSGEASFEWHQNRLLKSVNASADDQTGQMIVNVLSGVGKVATAAFVPAGATDCSGAIVDAINAVDKATVDVKAASDDLDLKKTRFARIDTTVKALGEGAGRKLQQAWVNADGQMKASEVDLEAKKKALAVALRKVTYSYADTWPKTGAEFATDSPIGIPDAVLNKWDLSSFQGDVAKYQVYLSLISRETFNNSQAVPSVEGWKGIPYREPALATFKICSNAPCTDSRSEEVDSFDVPVLQLGPVILLPAENRAFASNKMSGVLNEQGLLESAGYSQVRSSASGASETLKSLGEQVGAVSSFKHVEDTQELEQKLKEAKLKKDLADALKSNNPASDTEIQIKALQSQTALVEAETKLLEAQKLRAEAALVSP